VRGEQKTIGTADLKHICCAIRTMSLEWQTDCFIQTVSWKVVRSCKFWNRKICGWFHSHFLKYWQADMCWHLRFWIKSMVIV